MLDQPLTSHGSISLRSMAKNQLECNPRNVFVDTIALLSFPFMYAVQLATFSELLFSGL